MSDYFDEFKMGLDNAYKVVQTVWKLFEGLASQSQLVLDPDIPDGPFRIAVRTSAGPGPPHNTFEGTVTVDDEILELSEATRKTTYQVYNALPKVVIEGLDCHVSIECITPSGAPIYREVLEPIEIICFQKMHLMRDVSGSGYIQTDYDVYTESDLHVGDHIRYADPHQHAIIDIYVKNIVFAVDLEDNSQKFRVLNCA
jgi:hypothetical protein